jgi:hypothetical protein
LTKTIRRRADLCRFDDVMGYIVTPSIHINRDLATVWLNRE